MGNLEGQLGNTESKSDYGALKFWSTLIQKG
jgi:hypothetical protein